MEILDFIKSIYGGELPSKFYIDDNHVELSDGTIHITKSSYPLAKLISKFSDSQWDMILNEFEDVTGYSLEDVNNFYKDHKYSELYALIIQVASSIADSFNEVLDSEEVLLA